MYLKSNFIPADLYDKFITSIPEFKDKPISLFNDYIPSYEELSINPYNILILNEPNELFGLHDWAIQNSHLFSVILTWSQKVLDSCKNSILFPFGMSFLWQVPDFYENIDIHQKIFKVFFVCGSKKMTQGHLFRHKIYDKQNEITIQKNWMYTCPVEEKNDNFVDSMFHVAIENSKHQNYFTEKIIDAFLTKTIPIYCGCSNIGDFFDINGIMSFNTEEEMVNILNSLSTEDYWKRLDSINYNYQMANYWKNYYERLLDLLKEIIILNNI